MTRDPELLERFVKCAPKEWEAASSKSEPNTIGWISQEPGGLDIRVDLSDDHESAEAIIFLWDWLHVRFRGLRNFDGKGWVVLDYNKQYPDPSDIGSPTRIEVLVRAVIAVQEAR